MINLFFLLMVAAGVGVAAQVAINSRLAAVVGASIWAANINFAVSLIIGVLALSVTVLMGQPSAPAPALWAAPRWLWLGGLFGATYVLMAILMAHRLGAALLSAAVILGQVGASLVIDHYGWIGMPVHRLSAARVMGAVLLVTGVALIRWK